MGLLKGFELEALQGLQALPEAEPPLEDPGLLGAIEASFDRARAGPDWGWNQARYENDAMDRIYGALAERGRAVPRVGLNQVTAYQRRIDRGEKLLPGQQRFLGLFGETMAAVAAERKRDPKFLSDMGDVRDLASLNQWVIRQRQQDVAVADRRLAGASGGEWLAGAIVGGLGAGLLDPTSYIPVGGGATAGASAARQILTVAGKEALANAGLTVAMDPMVDVDAARIGEKRTLADSAADVGLAALTGGVIGGGAKGLDIALPEIRERLIARYFDHLPAAMKQRMIDAGTIDQRIEAAAVPEMLGPDRMTADERAARSVLEADADLREANPFRSNLAGDLLHGQRLSAAIDALLNDVPPPDFAPPARPSLRSTTALARGDREIAARIMQVESGGNPNARNRQPGQTASGLGQFIDETWLSGVKRWFPSRARGLSDEQLLALKTDPVLGRQMTERAVAEYRGALDRADQPVTAGNAYLMHFLGPKRALDLLRAPRSMEVKRFLPEAVISANERILRGKTVGDVLAWANRSMGEAEDLAPRMREGGAADDVVELRPEQFDSRADQARAEDALYGGRARPEPTIEDLGAAVASAPEAIAPDVARVVELADRVRRPREEGPADLLTQIARLGGLRDDEGYDFGGTAGLGRRMTRGGPVLRKGGLSVDELGERLWEAGWFGPPSQVERPTLDEMVDLVEEGARSRVYRPEDRPIVDERLRALDDGADEIEQMIGSAAADLGIEVDAPLHAETEARIRRGEDPDEALIGAINDRMFDEMAAARPAEPGELADMPDGLLDDADWVQVEEQRRSLEAFDDPDGAGAIAQTMSIEHDLRMSIDAGIEERFVLDDGGEARSVAEILDEADREEAAAAAMRACMIPTGATE